MLFSGPIDFTRDYEARKKYTYIYINIHIYIKRAILYINIIINIIITHRGGGDSSYLAIATKRISSRRAKGRDGGRGGGRRRGGCRIPRALD